MFDYEYDEQLDEQEATIRGCMILFVLWIGVLFAGVAWAISMVVR